jgi:hypothetical protein
MAEQYKACKPYPYRYRGKCLWLAISLIGFPPLGLLLLLLNGAIRYDDHYYGLRYNGKQGWLLFWTILFFPIAMLLAIINGFDLVEIVDMEK